MGSYISFSTNRKDFGSTPSFRVSPRHNRINAFFLCFKEQGVAGDTCKESSRYTKYDGSMDVCDESCEFQKESENKLVCTLYEVCCRFKYFMA